MTYSLTATTPACNIPLEAIANATYGNPCIDTLRVSKESQLETIPRPRKDSSYAYVYDIFGVLRTIYITGTNHGTLTQLKKFILDIEARINGLQSANTTPAKTTLLTLSMGGG